MAISDAGFGGEARVLMAVPDSGCVGIGRGSHGSPRRWLWGGRIGGSYGSPISGCVRGEARVLMAVPDAGCGGIGGGSHGSPRLWLWGG